jgi:Uma2 family endonuclease
MTDLGLFHGQRAELIDGDVMVLSPQKFEHYAAVDRVAEAFRGHFGLGYWVRSQAPMGFGLFTEPEPDISVVVGRREDYTDHPGQALIIVEVSDSTLSYDRNSKASLYACAGVTDYWIVNLVDGQLEVYRSPVADPPSDHGYRFSTRDVYTAGMSVEPLATPGRSLSVSALLG